MKINHRELEKKISMSCQAVPHTLYLVLDVDNIICNYVVVMIAGLVFADP